MVPPSGTDGRSASDKSEGAAIEFSLLNLPIIEIIVCGHSECGAMHALIRGRNDITAPNLKSWLRHGDRAWKKMMEGATFGAQLERHNQLSQLNVLEQIEHLKTYPLVRQRLSKGTLRLHGWYFDIKEADVYEYDTDDGKFHLIDEEYAEILLAKANAGQ